MELHQLRYFVAVAETGSFTRAAARERVSQPALSQQVRKLERRLRRPLFDRLGRGVLLTDAGRHLLGRAAAILAAVDEAERGLREGQEDAGRLVVGAIPTVAPYLVAPALGPFLRRSPAVELALHEDLTEHLTAALLSGDLDLAIMALPVADEHLTAERLLTEPLLAALPRKHRLAARRRLALADLREEPFILLSEMHCLGGQVGAYCRQHGLRVACRSAQIPTVQTLIGLGLGVSLLPRMAAAADRGGPRAYRPLAGGGPRRTLAVVRHRQRYLSRTAERFIARLREAVRESGWTAAGG
jgi:LysR family hydrogen peroxide-inducible transcriptional activator